MRPTTGDADRIDPCTNCNLESSAADMPRARSPEASAGGGQASLSWHATPRASTHAAGGRTGQVRVCDSECALAGRVRLRRVRTLLRGRLGATLSVREDRALTPVSPRDRCTKPPACLASDCAQCGPRTTSICDPHRWRIPDAPELARERLPSSTRTHTGHSTHPHMMSHRPFDVSSSSA